MPSLNVYPQKTSADLWAFLRRSTKPLGMLTRVVCTRFVYQAVSSLLRTRGKYLS